MLALKSLSLDDAKIIAAGARAKAEGEGWSVVIAIHDAGGHLIYLERADGTQLASVVVAQEKARTALLFKRPSRAFEDTVLAGRINVTTMPMAVAIEGGLPVVHGGQVVGAVGVSGVTSAEDALAARAGIEAFAAVYPE